MIRLPVSGVEVSLRQPGGAEDVLLGEATECNTDLALALLARVARPTHDNVVRWESLVVTDIDSLLLRLREMIFGDLISADMACPASDCRARIDVSFHIDEYLSHYEPRTPRLVEKADDGGWFRLRNTNVSFRLPTAADQLAVADHPQAEQELIRRCVRPDNPPARLLRRVQAAMQAMAPSLADTIKGTCPECAATVDIYFDPRSFVLRELRGQADFVYSDVHLIAQRYHWPEKEILSLPRLRRINYAEMIRRELSFD